MAWHYYTGTEPISDDVIFDATAFSLQLIDRDADSPAHATGWGYEPGDPEPPHP